MFPIAVGIPAFTNVTGLARLIPSLYEQEDVAVELYVVCNYSKSWEWLDQWDARFWRMVRAHIWPCADHRSVAQSWNLMAKKAFQDGHEQIVMLNDDVTLTGPHNLLDFRWANTLWEGKTLFTAGVDGWHAFSLPKKLYDAVGEFDEGFWPAYYEDNDYSRRIALHGSEFRELAINIPIEHELRGSQRGHDDVRIWLEKTQPVVHNRYVSKWGGSAKHEVFDKPWNGQPPGDSSRVQLESMGLGKP